MKSLGVKSTDAPNRQKKEKKGKKFFVEIHSKQVGKRLANNGTETDHCLGNQLLLSTLITQQRALG
jgi:hypothetical protein